MKKLFLSSVFVCLFTINHSASAQDKNNQPDTNSQNTAPSPITVNQKLGSWQLHCAYPNPNEPNKTKNTSQGCIAQQSLTIKNKENTQTPVASLILEKIKDLKNPQKNTPYQLTIVTPLGFSLQEPINLEVSPNHSIHLPWVTCTTNGCLASQSIDASLQKSLETSKEANLVIHRINKTTVTINFNIEDLRHVFPAINELVNKKTP